MWCNVKAAALNATLQLLVIYRYRLISCETTYIVIVKKPQQHKSPYKLLPPKRRKNSKQSYGLLSYQIKLCM